MGLHEQSSMYSFLFSSMVFPHSESARGGREWSLTDSRRFASSERVQVFPPTAFFRLAGRPTLRPSSQLAAQVGMEGTDTGVSAHRSLVGYRAGLTVWRHAATPLCPTLVC